MKHHRYEYSRCFGRIATQALLIALLLGVSASAVAQSTPNIGYCTNCSTAGFAWTAEQATPPTPGTHPVYAIDRANGEVRYFDVAVWWDCGGNDPQSGDPGDSRIFIGTTLAIQSNCIHKEAVQGTGSAQVILAMQDAHGVVMAFGQALASSISAGDLGLDTGSAIDLVGPEDSPAGGLRNGLRNAINNHYSEVPGILAATLQELARRIVRKYLGEGMVDGAVVTVTFDDGTSIRVKVENILDELGSGLDFFLELEVLTDSVQGPGMSWVPQSAGQFNNYNYEGGQDIAMALLLLSERLGAAASGLACSFSCDASGDCTLACVRR